MAVSNTSDSDTSAETLPGLISEATYWLLVYVFLGVNTLAGVFATGANIIIIITIYRKLGYADSTNISLTALAISDLGIAITTLATSLGIFLKIVSNIPFTLDVLYAITGSPHVDFIRVSALITTYITIERYLCVSFPLKINSIITARRTLVAVVMSFFAIFCLLPLSVLRNQIHWKFYPEFNRSLLTMTPSTDPIILSLYFGDMIYKSVLLPILTFFMVLSATILLALSLRRTKAWREANISQPRTSMAMQKNKEMRAIKMVMAIATVFIFSSIPFTAYILVIIIVPGFTLSGRYMYLFILTGMLSTLNACINCSANLIIYYCMSSKFKHAMQAMFRRNAWYIVNTFYVVYFISYNDLIEW